MDMSFMAKFKVQGRDAGRLLDHISANSSMANRADHLHPVAQRGGQARSRPHRHQARDDDFLVVASDTAHRHAETWMKRHITDDMHAFVTDVTSGLAQINVQGPKSRELLQSLTSVDLSNEAFPFRAAREIDLGYARALCVRITYLGELGYELYIPTEQATPCLRPHRRGRTEVWPAACGPEGAGEPAYGKGLSRLRPRHRQHRHRSRSRARLRGRPQQARRLHRQGSGAGAKGRGPAEASAGAGPGQRPGAACSSMPRWSAATGRRSATSRAASYGFTLGGAVGLAMIDADEPITRSISTVPLGPSTLLARSTPRLRLCVRSTIRRTNAFAASHSWARTQRSRLQVMPVSIASVPRMPNRIGGRLCLDFVNTVDPRVGSRDGSSGHDYLLSFSDVLDWFVTTDVELPRNVSRLRRLGRADAARAERAFAHVVAMRDSLYAVLLASVMRESVQAGELRELNEALGSGIGHRVLLPDNRGGVREGWRRSDSLEQVLWPVAIDAWDLLTEPELERVMQCPPDSGGCGWLFLDTSRSGNRRWCDMRTCGNRAKARAHYSRVAL